MNPRNSKDNPGGGITTGNTIHGNTAYGPSGGNAKGYATSSGYRSRDGSGLGPGTSNFSNFRNLDGSAMYGGGPGAPGGAGIRAGNAGVASAMAGMFARPPQPTAARPGVAPTPGILDEEIVAPPTWGPVTKAMLPALFGKRPAAPAPATGQVLNPRGHWAGQGSWYAGPNYTNQYIGNQNQRPQYDPDSAQGVVSNQTEYKRGGNYPGMPAPNGQAGITRR